MLLPALALAASFQAAPAAPPTHGLATRPFTPRADAFVPGTRPHFLDHATRHTPPFRRSEAAKVIDTFEVVFLTRTRPVRVRVVANVTGQSLNERFETHLTAMFKASDRDADRTLNRYECELMFSKTEFRSMLAGGFAFRGQSGALPSLEVVDRDDDGKVTFEEFAEYYTSELGKLTTARPTYARPTGGDQFTPELFARLDADKDGKLTEAELSAAEKILIPLDADEDETVNGAELLANSVRPARLSATGSGMMMDGMTGGRGDGEAGRLPDDVQVFMGGLPGTVLQAVIKRYDTSGDYDLSAKEVAFDKAVFDKLDANKDGNLSAAELEAWRAGDPDVIVTLTVANTLDACKAEAKLIGGGNGVVVPKQAASDRLVLRVDKQTIDLAAVPTPDYARTGTNPYGYLFPADKKYLVEKDLIGPQYQFLRVAFDPADFDGDGKLTRDEFDRYFALQQKTSQLGLTLTHAVQIPNLFQLLDGNGDGRLGVKELRTAYARLHPLEPSDGKEVTKAILQPSVTVRLGNTLYGAADSAIYNVQAEPSFGRTRPASAGPVWFHKMDRNGDGDISRGEFLGGMDDFDKLDANKDGLIGLEEAEAADAKSRKK